jgi:hypothetical protein
LAGIGKKLPGSLWMLRNNCFVAHYPALTVSAAKRAAQINKQNTTFSIIWDFCSQRSACRALQFFNCTLRKDTRRKNGIAPRDWINRDRPFFRISRAESCKNQVLSAE